MVRRLLVLVLTAGAVGFGAQAAYACSCVEPPRGLRAAVGDAEVAFVGEVVERVRKGEYLVRVDGVFKGRLSRFERVTADTQTSCARDVELGPLLYAGSKPLEVRQCMFAVDGDQVAEMVAAARLPSVPPDSSGDAWPTDRIPRWALGGLLAFVAVVSVTSLRRKDATWHVSE